MLVHQWFIVLIHRDLNKMLVYHGPRPHHHYWKNHNVLQAYLEMKFVTMVTIQLSNNTVVQILASLANFSPHLSAH